MKKLKTAIWALFDRRTPWAAKLFVAASILYGVWPLDLIPDFLPPFGAIDDVSLILLAIYWFLKHTHHIRADLAKKN